MRVAVGADHKGVEVKEKVKQILVSLGHEVTDFGTDGTESVDYPDFGLKVAHAVADHTVDRGINICWTGNGMNMAANKVKGVRSGLVIEPEMAYLTRRHNDANVMSLAAKYSQLDKLDEIVRLFLETEFEGGRHVARLDKIKAAEREGC
ncbi:MAG: ribose 5-phosphate isomerase B [candidate division Zixibacteria bacterium]|jgi:ribose 5-phosphate isomerase B|nr:ribose 5-phosphate isomerase B [candidate division Zixibacteria bacterium]